MPTFTHNQLEDLTTSIFAATGAPPDIAAHVARSLVESNLMGHDSHGMIRVLQYLDSIKKGGLSPSARPSILKETPTTTVIDGNWAFGQITAHYATSLAIEKARSQHVAAISMVRLNHIGRLGEYTDLAAKNGMFAMMTGGSQYNGPVAPYGGQKRLLGTNPLAFALPGLAGGTIVADMATCVVAEGKVRVARAKGQKVPPGTIVDKDGNSTTDPEDFYSGGALLTFGGHKGYALSVIAELISRFAGCGDKMTNDDLCFGAFLMMVNLEAFRPVAEFREVVGARVSEIKSVKPAEGFSEILMPGEPESRTRARRLVEGIVLPEDTVRKLADIAAGYDIVMPVPIA